MRFLFPLVFSVGLLCTLHAGAAWELPNTPLASMGDPGSIYLTDPGAVFHVNNNDFLGATDKLMSGSTGLYYYRLDDDKESPQGYELSWNARLLIPILATRIGQPPLPKPVGVYADNMEVRAGYSRIISNIKLEGSISADLYGHYNGDEVQKRVHAIVGSVDHQYYYGEKFYSSYVSGALGVGFILSPNFLLMGYYRDAAVMKDFILRLNYQYVLGNFKFGAQYETAYALSTNLYENDSLERTHNGWALSVKWKFIQSTVSYISKYLHEDDFGQYYIDPIILSYEF